MPTTPKGHTYRTTKLAIPDARYPVWQVYVGSTLVGHITKSKYTPRTYHAISEQGTITQPMIWRYERLGQLVDSLITGSLV